MHCLNKIVVLGAIALLPACADTPTSHQRGQPPHPLTRMEGFLTRGEVRTGWVHGPDGQPLEITYEVIDGRAIWEGDIDLGPAAGVAATREQLARATGPRYGVTTTASSTRWSNGVVPYVVGAGQASRVNWAITEIHAKVAGVKFVPRTTESSYLSIGGGDGCVSDAIGRKGGVQYVTLGQYCSNGNAAHELLHVLGMGHEQSRCDRDSYVQVVWSGVDQLGLRSQFDLLCPSAFQVLLGYDEGSIMHYNDVIYDDNSATYVRVMNSLRGREGEMGQRDSLDASDIGTLNAIYKPYAPANYTVTYPGNVPSFSWSASPRATSYSLYLTEIVEEYIPDRGTTTYEYSTPAGTTTGTSLTDPSRSYTGVDQCYTYEDGGYITTHYWYDLYANFDNGVSSKVARADAKVATC